MKEAADQEFRLRVLRPDLAHDVAPDFRREVVSHQHKDHPLNSIALNAVRDRTFDCAMWAEYHANLNELAPEGEALLAQLMTGEPDASIDVQPDGRVLKVPEGPTESTASVKVRRCQQYFRQAVLNTYQGRCAVTGLAVRDLLVASHIIPWNAAEQHRLDSQNGIALNALHDKAFDRGLITFDTALRLVCSKALKDHFANATVARHFQTYEGKPLTIPAEAAGPKPEYMAWHRSHHGL